MRGTAVRGAASPCSRFYKSWIPIHKTGSRCGIVWPGFRCRAASPEAAERTSLIPGTLRDLERDTEWQAVQQKLEVSGQAALTREEARARKRALHNLNLPAFSQKVKESGAAGLSRGVTQILQLNVGLYCNQACSHCHVESSPKRVDEVMSKATAQRCLQLLAQSPDVSILDLTGGAPELTPQFKFLVREAHALGVPTIIDRCNLTVLLEPGQEDLVEFLAAHKVTVVASLPCYTADNVDKQRGRDVFTRSIQGLKLLNAAGYGVPGSGLELNLVYNPGGAFLAPAQEKLEPAYKQELKQVHGVVFNRLLCLNNMPIKRFADWLLRAGALEEYMGLLVNAFNSATVAGLMCRDTLSVNWQGHVFDCDFNQQLGLALGPGPKPASSSNGSETGGSRKGLSVWDIDSLSELTGGSIAVGDHCYGCTAGAGSGCQGAVSS